LTLTYLFSMEVTTLTKILFFALFCWLVRKPFEIKKLLDRQVLAKWIWAFQRRQNLTFPHLEVKTWNKYKILACPLSNDKTVLRSIFNQQLPVAKVVLLVHMFCNWCLFTHLTMCAVHPEIDEARYIKKIVSPKRLHWFVRDTALVVTFAALQ